MSSCHYRDSFLPQTLKQRGSISARGLRIIQYHDTTASIMSSPSVPTYQEGSQTKKKNKRWQ